MVVFGMLRLSIRQELAMTQRLPGHPHHIGEQWLSSNTVVRTVLAIMPEGTKWQVVLTVRNREDDTAMLVEAMEGPLRRMLRDIGTELLKGVGEPADGDVWKRQERAVALFRGLTAEERECLRRLERAQDAASKEPPS